MTYKEGKALKESMLNYYECLRSGATKEEYKGETLMSYEVVEMINDCIDNALETVDKYRWHDLRKNPDDLPTKDGLYAIATLYDTDLTDVGFGEWENMYGYGSGWSALTPSYGKIIAWKEIEPFEAKE